MYLVVHFSTLKYMYISTLAGDGVAGDAGAGASIRLLWVTETQLWAADGLGPAQHDPHRRGRLQGRSRYNPSILDPNKHSRPSSIVSIGN